MRKLRLTRRRLAVVALVAVGSLPVVVVGSAQAAGRGERPVPCPATAGKAPVPERIRLACRIRRAALRRDRASEPMAHRRVRATGGAHAAVAGSKAPPEQTSGAVKTSTAGTSVGVVAASGAVLIVLIGACTLTATRFRRPPLEPPQ
jgi:hypothetical protein